MEAPHVSVESFVQLPASQEESSPPLWIPVSHIQAALNGTVCSVLVFLPEGRRMRQVDLNPEPRVKSDHSKDAAVQRNIVPGPVHTEHPLLALQRQSETVP